ncbi:prephenate dehydrogenase/arogenate dehydrogenase family protein [Luteimicrobium subarcticum]|uniref:Prephenate dehydrogenase n=1 Tax=Luteimicrobium subarcticum TaxID=620910 RepID=A0A2M8WUL1_9MICO|nr:prephenate dehydrogenase/arogenate dehydrogenase family protein [Luteimicrobium subarcticum]PJI94631.1 prephenate dehydrogenase [Luteimicrobium subarcticum]
MSKVIGEDDSSVGATVGVVGLGLIGGSLARTLVAGGVPVVATDPDPATRAAASAAGITVADDVAGVCAAAQRAVVLACPLVALDDVLARVAAAGIAPGCVLTDVGSVKTAVHARVAAAGLADRFVGAHPMAGTEHSGFAASSADLLPGARWAVTPGDAPADAVRAVLALVLGPLDAGGVYVVEPDVHDRAVALVSHVPHVTATVLLSTVADAEAAGLAVGLAAGSFRDGTRVARTDPLRTRAMVAGNAAAVAPVLRALAAEVAALADGLDAGDDAAVTAFFTRADGLRARLDGRRLVDGGADGTGTAADPAPEGGWTRDAPTHRVTLGAAGWRDTLTALGADGWCVTVLVRGIAHAHPLLPPG